MPFGIWQGRRGCGLRMYWQPPSQTDCRNRWKHDERRIPNEFQTYAPLLSISSSLLIKKCGYNSWLTLRTFFLQVSKISKSTTAWLCKTLSLVYMTTCAQLYLKKFTNLHTGSTLTDRVEYFFFLFLDPCAISFFSLISEPFFFWI